MDHDIPAESTGDRFPPDLVMSHFEKNRELQNRRFDPLRKFREGIARRVGAAWGASLRAAMASTQKGHDAQENTTRSALSMSRATAAAGLSATGPQSLEPPLASLTFCEHVKMIWENEGQDRALKYGHISGRFITKRTIIFGEKRVGKI